MEIPRIIPLIDTNHTPQDEEMPDHTYLSVTAGFGDQDSVLVFRTMDDIHVLSDGEIKSFYSVTFLTQ